MKSGTGSLIGILLITGGFLIATLVAGNSILLGLDLQGGVEVVLQPTEGQDASAEELDTAVEIIRNRVDALGVAEPDITRQGDNIVVQLPGVDDQQRAIELVGQTAKLLFRPVLAGPVTEAEALGDGQFGELTPPEDDIEDSIVVLASDEGRYILGPALTTGAALEGADAELQQVEWVVRVTARPGEDGIELFNAAARACFGRTAECPTGQLAIVLDGKVVSAPAIQAPDFDRSNIYLSGAFSEGEARDISLVLDFGALPVEFDDPVETGLVRTVSATLGRDALEAGVIAGAIGLLLVGAYMIAYYRLLGVAALASLAISATLLFCIVAFLSETRGLALTLAGVTGLIVSIGVSLDSNVVYFEQLKEAVVGGRTVRSAADRTFPPAFRTVFWANMATLIGAAVLYFLTVGSVKGFALMLGIASILDLVATYFFLRPAVHLMVASDALVDRPRLFGMPRYDDDHDDDAATDTIPDDGADDTAAEESSADETVEANT
jgi:preprotein translocase subunit SecD